MSKKEEKRGGGAKGPLVGCNIKQFLFIGEEKSAVSRFKPKLKVLSGARARGIGSSQNRCLAKKI